MFSVPAFKISANSAQKGLIEFRIFQVALLSTKAVQREQIEAPPVTQSEVQVTSHFKEVSIDHFGKDGNTTGAEEYRMPHPVWY